MSVFRIEELIDFSPDDIDHLGKDLATTHRIQAQFGTDAEGNTFPSYTPEYARRKAAGKVLKRPHSKQVTPPNLTLTGDMFKEFKYIKGAKVSSELFIDYGIEDPTQAKKMKALNLGRFGRPSKRGKVTIRKDKARVVAKNQKVGPEVEERIAFNFAKNIEKNLRRLTTRPTIIRM